MKAAPIKTGNRLEELDSLRGIAAITVVGLHTCNVFALLPSMPKALTVSPLRFLWQGHQAVILFFILSGFVLALPYLRREQGDQSLSYSIFLIKRICRIYIPYVCAILLGLLARTLFAQGEISDAWGGSLDWNTIWGHLLLIGTFDQNAIDPVVWSLVHEMRISILFPLLMFFIVRYGWKTNLGVGLLLSCLGIALHYVFRDRIDPTTNFFDTLHYLLMFIGGALLAKHRVALWSGYRKLDTKYKMVLLAFGFLAYTYSNVRGNIIVHDAAQWATTLGGAILILGASAETRLTHLLQTKTLLFFGKISYSMYLFHLIVLLTVASVFSGILPVWLLVTMSLLGSFLLAVIAYSLIERPSMKLGRSITRRKKEPITTTTAVK